METATAPRIEVRNPYRFEPLPEGQTDFLSRPEDEVLFGGSAGPGKTTALVIDALGLQYKYDAIGKEAFKYPEYRAVLFRRETPQLSKLIDESQKYYPSLKGTFVSRRTGEPGACWDFPSGAKIFLCHLENELDKHNHDSLEYQYIGFDELTQFTLTQYLHLLTRTRSTVKGLTCRVRSATNPIGEGLWWVRKRFPVLEPFTSKSYLPAEDPRENPAGIEVSEGTKYSMSRVFVPGDLNLNTYINKEEYIPKLKAGGIQKEKALLRGDWNAFGGDFFQGFDIGNDVIAPFEIDEHWPLTLSIDPGWGGVCSAGLNAYDFDGNVYRVATYYARAKNPEENAKGIQTFWKDNKFTKGRKPETMVGGKDAWAHKDKQSILADERTFADVFFSYGMALIPAITDRHNGWGTWKALFKTETQPARFKVFKGFNDPLLAEMATMVTDEKDPDDISGKGNDPDVADHSCFVAGTSVLTLDGYKPIEQIAVGENIYTRDGFRTVRHTHKIENSEAFEYVLDGRKFQCTPDHRFFTEESGFKKIHNLTSNDTLCFLDKKEYQECQSMERRRLSSLTESSLDAIPIPQKQTTGNITDVRQGITRIEAKFLGRRTVFDLTIEGTHEFFVNDVLVHNCDDNRYNIMSSYKPMKRVEEPQGWASQWAKRSKAQAVGSGWQPGMG